MLHVGIDAKTFPRENLFVSLARQFSMLIGKSREGKARRRRENHLMQSSVCFEISWKSVVDLWLISNILSSSCILDCIQEWKEAAKSEKQTKIVSDKHGGIMLWIWMWNNKSELSAVARNNKKKIKGIRDPWGIEEIKKRKSGEALEQTVLHFFFEE